MLNLLPFRISFLCLASMLLLAHPAQAENTEEEGFSQEEVVQAAEDFFGGATEGLAKVVEKVFADYGRPNAYIAGEEASGAIGVGLRYGKGNLMSKSLPARDVHWQGPSIGFDLGGNAAKVFMLVYGLENTKDLFRRFPGGEGMIYVVGGVGAHYLHSGGITLAPIRTGVGLRAGLNVNYIHFTEESSWNPF